MRYRPEHKEETRSRILVAAGQGFRRKGFDGIGIDALAKEAEVTSGAFYGHFKSKDQAFREVVVAGLRELKDAVLEFRDVHGEDWLPAFVDFYLNDRRTCDPGESCALQSLAPDVQRAGDDIRGVFETEVLEVVHAVADGLASGDRSVRIGKAWALLSLLSGGVTLARSVSDTATSEAIAQGARAAALAAFT